MKWALFDSLYCPEQWFCSHLDSLGHYLREAGEQVAQIAVNHPGPHVPPWDFLGVEPDVSFFLDRYEIAQGTAGRIKIAQVAARCSPMPWQVRGPGGARIFSLIISSIPAMVEEAKANGHEAIYQPLAFDLRARACMMGVKREKKAIFIGTRSPNHRRREEWLTELADIVEVVPPVFGRQMFATLASARVVVSAHAEWSKGAANCMRLFEAAGMGAAVVSDGIRPDVPEWPRPIHYAAETASEAREAIGLYLSDSNRFKRDAEISTEEVLRLHTYESRIPDLIRWAKEL